MLAGGESLQARTSWRFAVAAYGEVLRVVGKNNAAAAAAADGDGDGDDDAAADDDTGNDSLPSLGIGIALLGGAHARTTRTRGAAAERALAMLSWYATSREKRAATANAAAVVAAAAESAAGIAGGVHAMRLAAPAHLPARLARTEALYNTARAVHQLGLPAAGAAGYRAALVASRGPGTIAATNAAQVPNASGEIRAIAPNGPMDLSREAAYNAALVAKLSGDNARALSLTLEYLTYD